MKRPLSPRYRVQRHQSERVQINLRTELEMSEWFGEKALQVRCSRNELMQRCLEAIRKVVTDADKWREQGLSPFDAAETIGVNFMGEFIRMGLITDVMTEAWEEHRTKRATIVQEGMASKAERKGRQREQ